MRATSPAPRSDDAPAGIDSADPFNESVVGDAVADALIAFARAGYPGFTKKSNVLEDFQGAVDEAIWEEACRAARSIGADPDDPVVQAWILDAVWAFKDLADDAARYASPYELDPKEGRRAWELIYGHPDQDSSTPAPHSASYRRPVRAVHRLRGRSRAARAGRSRRAGSRRSSTRAGPDEDGDPEPPSARSRRRRQIQGAPG